MKLLPLTFLFFILTGCAAHSSKPNRETSECLHFRNMMASLVEPAALYALQEECLHSKGKTE
ncbi:hypothetical protein [Acinetobacter calcoaceticus]|uniref:hypothetical protein n=1 Tax=Acinetobacter calcoaceticus TaxID=471 RepID=UPI00192B1D64|nr:hypothetical protein [Acinetobacter calcoaceticus]